MVYYSPGHSMRRLRRRRRRNVRKFIGPAIKRPGALTATLRRWRILRGKRSVKDLSAAQLDRAYARARKMSRSARSSTRKMGTRIMRQINFYRRVLRPASKRKAAKARMRRMAVRPGRITRRKAANPRRRRRSRR